MASAEDDQAQCRNVVEKTWDPWVNRDTLPYAVATSYMQLLIFKFQLTSTREFMTRLSSRMTF